MEPDAIEGTVERVIYYARDSGYAVIKLKPSNPLETWTDVSVDGLLTAVGILPDVNPGVSLRLLGKWITHPKHGRQFEAERYEVVLPTTLDGIQNYLASGIIKGTGPVMAERIVEAFGEETLAVLDEAPGRLREVEGIGHKRAEQIRGAWEAQRYIQRIMLFLQSHGIGDRLAVKIHKQYGEEAIARVQQDPYQLAYDIMGIGFWTADKIARDVGLQKDAPQRIDAGLIHALSEATNDGHVYLPRHALLEAGVELLEVDRQMVDAGLDRLLQKETLVAEVVGSSKETAIYLAVQYFSEVGVAQRLAALINRSESRLKRLDSGDQRALKDESLTEDQMLAVRTALIDKVSVLTGGPGTGKTTTLRALISVLDGAGFRFALASPTGRAAKRLSDATGFPAKTIHRLLGYSFAEGFSYDPDNVLPVDMVVVDEASMLDLALMHNLLKAMDPDSHLLLVGDVDQLPSVGAGDVLRDMIASGAIPTTRLEMIFRQAIGSLIIENAHRVNQGQMPSTPDDAEDFFLFTKDNPAEAAGLLTDIVKNRIPRKFELDPLEDVQVLSPMHRGQIGVQALNRALQAALNPASPRLAERQIGETLFRVGDKIMQTRNNYDKDVYNGDIGRLRGIDFQEQQFEIVFDRRIVRYEWSEADELVHAYCISTHKSQGSEYTAVVMPAMMQHRVMLQRNLLYTAISRARRLVVLVGTRDAIHVAVNNNQVARRYTGLAARLKALVKA